LDIPWVSPASGSSRLADPPRRTVFALAPTYRDQAAALVKYAVEVMGRTRIAFFYQDDEFGREGLAGAREHLARYGLTPVIELSTGPEFTALKTRTLRLKEARPEVVIMWLAPTQAVILRRDAREFGLESFWMTGSALADAELLDRLTDGLWEGTIFTNVFEAPDSSHPLLTEYRRAFNKLAARGERWGLFYYAGFGLAEPLVEALRRCGPDLTRAGLVAQLEGLKDFKGIMGRITYGPDDRQGQEEMYICQAVQHGGTRPLTGWFRYQDLPPVPARLKPRPPEPEPTGEGGDDGVKKEAA
ncbi:MAG: ABC transporter substrate-binding protein, partial [Thermodesulfobacteriota bacterium]